MANLQAPVAIQLVDSYEIVDFILKYNLTATLICCACRSDFLADLQGKLNSNALLSPTLQLLATSRKVQLAFTPTLPHLRAYLAALNLRTNHNVAWLDCPQPRFLKQILVILGLVNLHRPSSEHSAQGISRTLAIAVEAARLAGVKLVLGEFCEKVNNEEVNGIHDGATGNSNWVQQDQWTEQIPILSGSVRFGNNEGLRTGSTVNVGKVLGRWCRFVTLDTILPGESQI